MRCSYRYPDDAQCTINAPIGKSMCTDHRLLVQMAKDKKKQDAKRPKTLAEGRPSRAKPRVEKLDDKPKSEEIGPSYYDHTAPWRCSQSNCDSCKDKPSYADYMKERELG